MCSPCIPTAACPWVTAPALLQRRGQCQPPLLPTLRRAAFLAAAATKPRTGPPAAGSSPLPLAGRSHPSWPDRRPNWPDGLQVHAAADMHRQNRRCAPPFRQSPCGVPLPVWTAPRCSAVLANTHPPSDACPLPTQSLVLKLLVAPTALSPRCLPGPPLQPLDTWPSWGVPPSAQLVGTLDGHPPAPLLTKASLDRRISSPPPLPLFPTPVSLMQPLSLRLPPNGP